MKILCQFKKLHTTPDGGFVIQFEADETQYTNAAGLPLLRDTNLIINISEDKLVKQLEQDNDMG